MKNTKKKAPVKKTSATKPATKRTTTKKCVNTQKKKPPLRKNVSQTIRRGTVIKTRDEFLEDNNGYRKPKYENTDTLYREFITLETNRKGEIVGVKVQSGGKESVFNLVGQEEKYNLILKSKDDEGNPIKLGKKYKRAKEKYSISEKDANNIKKDAVKHPNKYIRKQNIDKLRELKGRKKKKP